MSKRHRVNQSDKQVSPSFAQFTLEQFVLLEQALVPFEQHLVHARETLPNMAFARETITGLKGKISKLIESQGYGEAVGLDANEVIIIYTSLIFFSCGLAQVPSSSW